LLSNPEHNETVRRRLGWHGRWLTGVFHVSLFDGVRSYKERKALDRGLWCLLDKPGYWVWRLSNGPKGSFRPQFETLATRAGGNLDPNPPAGIRLAIFSSIMSSFISGEEVQINFPALMGLAHASDIEDLAARGLATSMELALIKARTPHDRTIPFFLK
jgi:hypothetical protein